MLKKPSPAGAALRQGSRRETRYRPFCRRKVFSIKALGASVGFRTPGGRETPDAAPIRPGSKALAMALCPRAHRIIHNIPVLARGWSSDGPLAPARGVRSSLAQHVVTVAVERREQIVKHAPLAGLDLGDLRRRPANRPTHYLFDMGPIGWQITTGDMTVGEVRRREKRPPEAPPRNG